jgi:hypothetical protein
MNEIYMTSLNLLKNTIDSRNWFASNISEDTELVSICSAYLKEEALQFLLKVFSENSYIGPIRILTRWKPNDLLTGSSDLSAYMLATNFKIPFFMKQNFHGKVYEIQPSGFLVGSANLTNSGFQLKGMGNSEVCVALNNSIENSLFVDDLFNSSTLVNDSLLSKIKNDLSSMKSIEFPDYEWSSSLLEDMKSLAKTERFLSDEMFFSNCHDFLRKINQFEFSITHDLSLLSCSSQSSNKDLSAAFLNSISFNWLINILGKHDGVMSYGALTSSLHSVLLDEPTPYRQDVKTLLSNLLSWCQEYSNGQIEISRPRHSQIIRLIIN